MTTYDCFIQIVALARRPGLNLLEETDAVEVSLNLGYGGRN